MNKLENILRYAIQKICLSGIGNVDGDINDFILYIQKISNNQLNDIRLMLAKTRRKKLFFSQIGFNFFPRNQCFGLVNDETERRIKNNIVINDNCERTTVKYKRFLPKSIGDGAL